MKKLLMGIFGLTLLLPFGVFAEGDITSVEEGNNKAETTVTIGTVEVPVYDVYMVWEKPSFDWTYNENTKTFGWTPTPYCSEAQGIDSIDKINEFIENGKMLYTDATCSTETHLYDETTTYYEKTERENYFFSIEDFSQYGEIVPSVKWTSKDEYNYVDGKISYWSKEPVCEVIDYEGNFESALNHEYVTIYNDNECKNIVEDRNIEYEENKYYALFTKETKKEISTGEIPDDGRHSYAGEYGPFYEETLQYPKTNYYLFLTLENKDKPTTTPTAGDTIGTITVTIRARETE